MKIERQYFTPDEQRELVAALRLLPYRPCPRFLGQFDFSQYLTTKRLPSVVVTAIDRLRTLVPEQDFNTYFLQRYRDYAYVKRHRDPFNNIGKTIIAVFGEFTGAISSHGRQTYTAQSGDVVIQDCTIGGVQGDYHSVGTILGERYAVILNTILR